MKGTFIFTERSQYKMTGPYPETEWDNSCLLKYTFLTRISFFSRHIFSSQYLFTIMYILEWNPVMYICIYSPVTVYNVTTVLQE